jgi:hypothetical protein
VVSTQSTTRYDHQVFFFFFFFVGSNDYVMVISSISVALQ